MKFPRNMLMMSNEILRRRIKIQVPWDSTFLSILSIVHLYEKLLIHKFMSSMENRRWLLFEIFTYFSFPFLKTLFPSTFPNGWVPTSNIIYTTTALHLWPIPNTTTYLLISIECYLTSKRFFYQGSIYIKYLLVYNFNKSI